MERLHEYAEENHAGGLDRPVDADECQDTDETGANLHRELSGNRPPNSAFPPRAFLRSIHLPENRQSPPCIHGWQLQKHSHYNVPL